MSLAPEHEPFAKPETLLRIPVGLASPLWGLFAGAAVGGATWWWMTRWARPENLEAMFAAAAKFEAAVEPEAAIAPTPAAETLEALIDAAPEPTATLATAEPEPEPEPAPTLTVVSDAEPEAVAETDPVPPIAEAVALEAPAPKASAPEPVEPDVVAGGAADVAFETAATPKVRKKAPPQPD